MSDKIAERRMELFQQFEAPEQPTWDDVVRLSYYEPIVRNAVAMASSPYSNVMREQALIIAVFALYNAKAGLCQREVDRISREVPDFIIIEGKRYDRRL